MLDLQPAPPTVLLSSTGGWTSDAIKSERDRVSKIRARHDTRRELLYTLHVDGARESRVREQEWGVLQKLFSGLFAQSRAFDSIPLAFALCGSSDLRSWTGTRSAERAVSPSKREGKRTRRWRERGVLSLSTRKCQPHSAPDLQLEALFRRASPFFERSTMVDGMSKQARTLLRSRARALPEDMMCPRRRREKFAVCMCVPVVM